MLHLRGIAARLTPATSLQPLADTLSQSINATAAIALSNDVRMPATIGRDAEFGLDEQAMKAAKQWQFRPGTREGKPVAVEVTLEMAFTLKK